MTHQLTLEIPEEVYQPLLQKAQAMGQTVEAVACAHLADSVQSLAPGSRLRRWAGAFASGMPDVATRHHDYLGQALYEELQGKKDA
jgi:hypothetical protein